MPATALPQGLSNGPRCVISCITGEITKGRRSSMFRMKRERGETMDFGIMCKRLGAIIGPAPR